MPKKLQHLPGKVLVWNKGRDRERKTLYVARHIWSRLIPIMLPAFQGLGWQISLAKSGKIDWHAVIWYIYQRITYVCHRKSLNVRWPGKCQYDRTFVQITTRSKSQSMKACQKLACELLQTLFKNMSHLKTLRKNKGLPICSLFLLNIPTPWSHACWLNLQIYLNNMSKRTEQKLSLHK